MTRTSKVVPVPPNPTYDVETAIQGFSDSSLAFEELKRRATTLLNGSEPLQELKSKEQRAFVDKVDQVCPESLDGQPILL